jgi:hypothetical protein
MLCISGIPFSRPIRSVRAQEPAPARVAVRQILERLVPSDVIADDRHGVRRDGVVGQSQPVDNGLGLHLVDLHEASRLGLQHLCTRLVGVERSCQRILNGVFIPVTKLIDPDFGSEEHRVQRGRAGSIGVKFTPDIHAASAHTHVQFVHEVVAGIVEVAGDGRGTEGRSVGQHLLNAVCLRGVGARRISEMKGRRPAVEPGEALQLEDLTRQNTVAHVAECRSHAGRAGGKARVDHAQDFVALLQRRRVPDQPFLSEPRWFIAWGVSMLVIPSSTSARANSCATHSRN